MKKRFAGVCLPLLGAAFLWGMTLTLLADQVVLQNGDRYNGIVLSVSSNEVVLQSDILGRVALPRAEVTQLAIISANGTNQPSIATTTVSTPRELPKAQTNTVADLSTIFRQLGMQSNLVQQVQSQFLAGAGPEANDKFNQMMSDLISGKMTLGDLRDQAKSAADQLRSLRKDLGDDAGSEMDSYLAILDNFLQEVEPTSSPVTNAPASSVTPTPTKTQ